MSNTAKNISLWLDGNYDEKTKQSVREILKDPRAAEDAFYTNLSFGTGGMRGVMGIGSNRLNVYTVRAATQGLANYVSSQPMPPQGHSAFIGYDSRHNSREFAEEVAKVLAANGIHVYLCREIRPTPLVSFGCRFKRCTTAIMITASHNPPEYNGYKVYWDDGSQVLPPHDRGIIAEVAKITDPSMVKVAKNLDNPLIEFVDENFDDLYISEGSQLQLYPEENKAFGNDLKLVYTSLHGTGITLEPKMLKAWGFTDVTYVDKQIIPDGNFPTIKSPNPEEQAAMRLGMEKLKEINGDILIATDPDADRVRIGVNHKGEIFLLDGHQIAVICLSYICKALTKQNRMPAKAAFIKTIGTSELFKAICDDYRKTCVNVLPGFKYIAEKIRQWKTDTSSYQYIFGVEESYGYLLGTNTRDKDGIVTSALLCEIALEAKRRGQNLIELLHDIYRAHGVYFDRVLSVDFQESKEGRQMMAQSMISLRSHIPTQIDGIDIISIEDYQSSLRKDLKTGKTEKITLPKSNILLFWLSDKSKIMVRPSGTEPKVKLYCGVVDQSQTPIDIALKNCQTKADRLLSALYQSAFT